MGITLALGGGGAKGMAHIGVLKVLEQNKIPIRAIAGTSIGGLVGAVYLSGIGPDEILDRFSAIEQAKLYGHMKEDEPSLFGLAGAVKVLSGLLGDKTFDDLPIPFAVTAVDINTGQMVVINEGRLLDAVLTTIAVPGIFPARRVGQQLLVDGGVVNPVPVDVARSLTISKFPVVAVVLTEISEKGVALPVPEIPGAAPVSEYLSRLRITQALNVFTRSIEIEGKYLTELRLEKDAPEVIVRPGLTGIGLLDKVDVRKLAGNGEEAMLEVMPEMESHFGLSGFMSRLFGKKRG